MSSADFQIIIAGLLLIVTAIGMLGTGLWRLNAMRDAILKQVAESFLRFETRLTEHEDRSSDRASMIERDLSEFKLYAERQFISKDTFNNLVEKTSIEMRLTRGEILERIERLEKTLMKRPD